MQLEPGKYYRNRAGKIRGPLEEGENASLYPFRESGVTYTRSGDRYLTGAGSGCDLIEEYRPPLNATPRYDDSGNVTEWILPEGPAAAALRERMAAIYGEEVAPAGFDEPGYEGLRAILLDAYNQSAKGKGKERHATEGTPWHDQPMVADLHALGSMHAAIFQARKKSLEACRLDYHRARCDLLGAIVYLAAAVRWLDDMEAPQCAQE